MNIHHHLKVTHDHKYIPRLILSGDWLTQCNFEINSRVLVSAKANMINMTTIKPAVFLDFHDDYEKLRAFAWLQNKATKHESIRQLMDDIQDSFVLTSTVLELISILLDRQIIR